ncbi:MAG TPA: CsbD family protein [Desulfuromonadaceae bacterium]
MKSSVKDQVKGMFHEVRGTAKEVAGKLSDNPKLEGEGLCEKIAGNVQKKVGQVEKVLEK